LNYFNNFNINGQFTPNDILTTKLNIFRFRRRYFKITRLCSLC